MSGNYAIGALGGYPSFNALDYQALAAVMNTPNPNAQVAFRGNSQSVQPTAVASTPQVQYVQAEPEKKGKRGKVVLGTILVAGAAACIYGFKKGNVDLKGFARVKDGLKTAWSSIRGKAGSTASEAVTKTAETAAEKATVGKRTIQEINGKTVVTLPGEKNVIAGKSARIALTDICENTGVTNAKKLTDILAKDSKGTVNLGRLGKGYEISSFVTETTEKVGTGLKAPEKTFKIFGVKGCEPKIYMDGKLVEKGLTEGVSDELYESLVKKANDVWGGRANLTQLKQIKVRYTDSKTGLITNLKSSATGKVSDLRFVSSVTDRFAVGSTKINSMRSKDKQFDQLFTAFKDKKGTNLNVLRANVKAAGHTFTIDGSGRVLAVKEAGTGKVFDAVQNEELFNDWCFRHKSTIEQIPKIDKKNWTDRVFEF